MRSFIEIPSIRSLALMAVVSLAVIGCLVQSNDHFCGDTKCDAGETSASCPIDCPSVCGDHACTNDETNLSCPQDCPVGCGDNVCRAGESESSCERDCSPRHGDACSAMCGPDHTCCPGPDGLVCVKSPGLCN